MSRSSKPSHPVESIANSGSNTGPVLLAAKPTFIDLFCGCGGFTLGMQRSGFDCLAAIDFNAEAVATLKTNLAAIPHVLERDLTQFAPEELAQLIGTKFVDVVVGGPPCQGFSTARQVDGANHGSRLKHDSRRFLFRDFLRFVDFFQPRVFVMENVLGLRSAAGGEYFTCVQNEARGLGSRSGRPGYRVHSQIEDAWELGVPQKRRRQLIIGVRNDIPGYFPTEFKLAPRAMPHTMLGAAIGDLPSLHAGGGEDECDYDFGRREKHFSEAGTIGRNYLLNVLEIEKADKLLNHVARPHNERDLRDFVRLREGENSATAMRDRGVEFEFPYDKSTFKDRYTRQSRSNPCSTIVAHLSKDGLMFIHPTQNRSFTPREAARVQSFPDWFRFPKARTHAFRVIGNAVPPLISEAVGLGIIHFFRNVADWSRGCVVKNGEAKIEPKRRRSISFSELTAASTLRSLLILDRHRLRSVLKNEFLKGWHALLFLFPGLHPDNARDHGNEIEIEPPHHLSEYGLEALLALRYARSGWPVALELIGKEAWRRFERKEIVLREFYCIEAQRAGLEWAKARSSAA